MMNNLRHPLEWFRNSIISWRDQHQKHPKPWTLFKQSMKDFRKHKRALVLIILTVILPVALLANLAVDPGSDTTLSAYLTFAQLAMNVALVYAIVQLLNGDQVGVRESYYKGSAMFIRMILVALMLTVMLLPLLLGLLIFAFGVVAPGTALSPAEKTLMGLLALIVSVPSIVMITRGLWGLYAIFETDLGPWEAIRHSRLLTKGKVVMTLGRMIALVFLLALMLVVPIGLLALLANFTQNVFVLVLIQVVIALTVLPLSNLYLYRYYKGLK
ncbi:MAG TPA: hypothetical protein VLF21_03230 [Candidatus Saccharimonadales bacterium]|nr:hypothetical protein [Candidatus Saccharimonadales bacterium]